MGTCASVRFINEYFFLWARPHKGLYRRRSLATLRIKTRGERRPGEKRTIYGRTLLIILAHGAEYIHYDAIGDGPPGVGNVRGDR